MTFEQFKAKCLERFGKKAICTEREDGSFCVRLDKPEIRTGQKSMHWPTPIEIGTPPEPASGQRAEGDEPEDEVTFSFSSETPVRSWFGDEILSHHPEDADLSRFTEVGACLYNHNHNQITGKPVSVWLDGTRAHCTEKFGTTELAQRAKTEVLVDQSLRGISVGFTVQEWVLLTNKEKSYRQIQGRDDEEVWVASKWQALEASHTPVPADPSVGVNRSAGEPAAEPEPPEDPPARTQTQIKQEKEIMDLKKRAVALGLDPETATWDDVIAEENKRAAAKATKAADKRNADELERQRQIRAMGEMHNLGTEAEDAIERNLSAGEFALELAAKKRAGTLPQANLSPSEEKDLKRFDYTKFLRQAADAQMGSGAMDGVELEMVQEGAKLARESALSPKGFMLPMMALGARTQDIQGRTLVTTSATSAGNIVATNLLADRFIDALRNRSVFGRVNATMLSGLVGNIDIPRQTNLIAAEELAETATSTVQDLTTDKVSMSPKRVAAVVAYSRTQLAQGTPDVDAWNRRELESGISLKIDSLGINGDGTTITGLRNISGVNSLVLGANGAALTWADVIKMETEISNDNADVETMFYIANAKTRGKLKGTSKIATQAVPIFIWEKGASMLQGEINGYPAVVSNQLLGNISKGSGTNLSTFIMGNFADAIWGFWGAIDFVVDPFSRKKESIVEVSAEVFADFAVRHPESFTISNDVKTT